MSGIQISQINAPCKDCPDRHMGCHGTCDLYKDYERAKLEYYAEKEKKWSEIEKYKIRRNRRNKF